MADKIKDVGIKTDTEDNNSRTGQVEKYTDLTSGDKNKLEDVLEDLKDVRLKENELTFKVNKFGNRLNPGVYPLVYVDSAVDEMVAANILIKAMMYTGSKSGKLIHTDDINTNVEIYLYCCRSIGDRDRLAIKGVYSDKTDRMVKGLESDIDNLLNPMKQ